MRSTPWFGGKRETIHAQHNGYHGKNVSNGVKTDDLRR